MPNHDQLDAFCKRFFGRVSDRVSYPGGKDRKTVIVSFGSDRFVVSRRRSAGRARLEAEVLSRLSHTRLVPDLIHQDAEYIVQEHVEGLRLSQKLDRATSTQRGELAEDGCRAAQLPPSTPQRVRQSLSGGAVLRGVTRCHGFFNHNPAAAFHRHRQRSGPGLQADNGRHPAD